MSYDLVFWRERAPQQDRADVWSRLSDGEAVESIEPLSQADVRAAFRAVFGKRLAPETDALAGPGFDARVDDRCVVVTCAWSLLKSDEGREVLAELHRVAERLGAFVFDPQTAAAPVDAGRKPPPGELSAMGPAERIDRRTPGENRAQSFGVVDLWSIAGLEGPSIHNLYIRGAGQHVSAKSSFHPSRLADVRCTYVRVVQDVFPFEIVYACGGGRSAEGTGVAFGQRVIGVVDGAVGFLGSPVSTLVREGKDIHSVWSGMQLAAPRVAAVDLTNRVDTAARRALEQAHAGDTRPLRDLIAHLVAIDSSGMAAEELFAPEVPPGDDVATAFEAFDSGAVMPLWSQRAGGACTVEARLRLPDSGGFTLKIVNRGFGAPQRHAFAPPLGPS